MFKFLKPLGEKAMALLDTLPKNKLNWGIVHGDIVPPNIVCVDGVANPIDFGACGFGPFLTDLAITLPLFIPMPDSNTLIGMESTFRYQMIMWNK